MTDVHAALFWICTSHSRYARVVRCLDLHESLPMRTSRIMTDVHEALFWVCTSHDRLALMMADVHEFPIGSARVIADVHEQPVSVFNNLTNKSQL